MNQPMHHQLATHPPPTHPTPHLQDVSSTEAAIIYTLEPVFGAGLAYVMLGERWGMSGWLGAGLIVASCLVAQLLGVEKEEHADKHDDPPSQLLATRK